MTNPGTNSPASPIPGMILQANRLQFFPPDPACPRQVVPLHDRPAYLFQKCYGWPPPFRLYVPQLNFPIQETETKPCIPSLAPDMHMGRAMLIPDKHRNDIAFVSTYSHRNPSVRLFSARQQFPSATRQPAPIPEAVSQISHHKKPGECRVVTTHAEGWKYPANARKSCSLSNPA